MFPALMTIYVYKTKLIVHFKFYYLTIKFDPRSWRMPHKRSCVCSGTHKDDCAGWVATAGPFEMGVR